jgi:hypothetical protein
MKTKEITVNGINLVLYKLGAIEQQTIFNKYILPVAATLGECFQKGASNEEIIAKFPAMLQKNLSPEAIQKFLFEILLSQNCVKIKAAGMEMPLVGTVDGKAAVMSSELDDIAYCWEVAVEVFRFNFSNLFTSALNLFARISNKAMSG